MRSLFAAAHHVAARRAGRSPDRPVINPKSLALPANPDARPVPIDDIGTSRSLYSSAWSADGKSVGIFGGSYDGFMSLMAIARTPDEFATSVQLYGIINWRTMYRDQDERLKAYQRSLLGTPEENLAVYR